MNFKSAEFRELGLNGWKMVYKLNYVGAIPFASMTSFSITYSSSGAPSLNGSQRIDAISNGTKYSITASPTVEAYILANSSVNSVISSLTIWYSC